MSTEEPPFLSRKSHVPSKQREKAEKVLLAIRARPGTRGKWGTPPQHDFAMCTNSANQMRCHRPTPRRYDPNQPTKSEVSGDYVLGVTCADQIVLSSMQVIELRPMGLDGSRCRSGEAPGPYTSCNCWACCAGSLSLFAFSQPPRDIRSGSGISEGRGWLVEGCVGGVRAGYSTAFLA